MIAQRKSGDGLTVLSVRLGGLRPIMFDRYPGDNKIDLPPEQKVYLNMESQLVIPALNISSFLAARNTDSCAKLLAGKVYKKLAAAILGYTSIDPLEIPLLRDNTPIGYNPKDIGASGVVILEHVAKLSGGIPNPKKRPTVELPWELAFELSIVENDEFDSTLLRTFFDKGGHLLGLGTFRGVYGKFEVLTWELV